ncbi:MAG: lysophospholipid acyltransferase family protein [Gallionella sp.]|nr:lysophospholipid acyltransferase family protein [Gallionella sp.]
MTSYLFATLFRFLSFLPLPALHGLGAILGRIIYIASSSYAQRMRENLRSARLHGSESEYQALLAQTISEAGKSVLELPWVWCRPVEQVYSAVRSIEGWEHVEAAQSAGRGLMVLTPHWGCFEVVGLYFGKHSAMTNLYRAPKQAWLERFMINGRARGLSKLAPADVSGVRLLFKALKRGEGIGLLPDQVPGNGEGEWVEFFHRPAYTMTLSGRLAQSSGAQVLLVSAERLPKGQGYTLRITPLDLDFTQSVPLQINQAMERTIAIAPAQYLWSYNRYKIPSGVTPPTQN